MKLLWLKADLLLPLDKGGKLRTWHLMRHLARRHEITYLAFADPGAPAADLAGMRDVCARLETVPRKEPAKRSLQFYAETAAHLLDPLPYAVGKYRSSRYRTRLQQLLRDTRFDLIVCDFLPPAVNLPPRLPCPAVIFTHNVEAEIWRRHTETTSSALARALYGVQHRRMQRFEAATLDRFDGILAVSDTDRLTFGRLYPRLAGREIHVIPTGVDTAYFSPNHQSSIANPIANCQSSMQSPIANRQSAIVFTGSMDWLPNEDAMVHFCREILPCIRRQVPSATLSIVGRAPTPVIRRLAGEFDVDVTGRVEDVRPFMANADVYVVPLRIGGGTRLKIFEAMAMGKAIVSTTVGAEGLPVTDGRHLLIADEPRPFADAVVRLLRDAGARQRLGDAARALVVAEYDWAAVAGSLESALAGVASRARRTIGGSDRLRPGYGVVAPESPLGSTRP